MADAIDADVAEALQQLKRGFKETQQSAAVPRPPMPMVQRPPAWEANKMPRVGSSMPMMPKAPSGPPLGPQLPPKAPSGPPLGPQLPPQALSGPPLGPQLPPQGGPQIGPPELAGAGGGLPGGLSVPGPGGSASFNTMGAGPGVFVSGAGGLCPNGLGAGGLGVGGLGGAFGGPNLAGGHLGAVATPGNVAVPPFAPNIGGCQCGKGVSGSSNGAKMQIHLDIPQSSVGLVIGKQASTINAIKVYSKANCFVDQHTGAGDRARVTIIGGVAEIEKCKRTVEGLVDGSVSTSMVNQLAVATPATDGVGALGAGIPGIGGNTPGGLNAAGLPGLAGASGLPSGSPGVMPPGGLHITTSGGGVPQMPNQVHDNLNEYYARWWAQYGANSAPQEAIEETVAETEPAEQSSGPAAFDKEALARLAQKAAHDEELEAQREAAAKSMAEGAISNFVTSNTTPQMTVPAPMQAMSPNAPRLPDAPIPQMVLPGPFSAPSQGHLNAAPMQQHVPPMQQHPPPMQQHPPPMQQHPPPNFSQVPPVIAPSAPPNRSTFSGFSINPVASAPAPPQKDNDSVQNMLQRLQNNMQQTKQAMSVKNTVLAPGPAGIPVPPLPGVPAAFMNVPDTGNKTAAEWDGSLENRIVNAHSPADIEDVGKQVLAKFPTLPPEQIAHLLLKLERMIGMYHGEFLVEMNRLLASRLKECTSTQFAALMSTFLMWGSDTKQRFSEFAKDFATTAFTELPSRLMEMAPHELNCCLAGFLALGQADQKFITAVGRSVVARHKTFGPSQLTTLLTIFAEMRLVHAELFTSVATVVCSRVRELRPVEILRLLRAFAKTNVQHETLCHAICLDVVSRTKDVQSPGFTADELCEIAWLMCVLESFNEDFLRFVCRHIEATPRMSTDALCMLYECHLTLDVEYKDVYSKFRVASDKLQTLHELYRANRKDSRRCSERLRTDVTNILKSLVEGTVTSNHRTSIGLLTDVAALRKRTSTDGYIHIEIDTATSSIRPLEGDDGNSPVILDGSVGLKRRILQKHNLRFITVRENEWRKLDGSKEKRRHLRTLIASLGDVLQ